MTTARSLLLLRHIRQLAAPAPADSSSDGELLRRFAGQREQDAFAALVRRHGPMVLGVCRRVLGNPHDAEDAFQAAFLTLARKAASLRRQESVGSWVYRVAYRLALRARARVGRRQAADRAASERRARQEPTGGDPLSEVTGRELSQVLDEELNRLPEAMRAPLVLCYLEGATRDEAALQLGWPVGTLKHRLERGRAILRGRLTRRGLALSAVLPGALLAPAARAAVPAALADSAVRAAGAALVGGVLGGRLRVAALLLLALGLAGASANLLLGRSAAESDPPPRAEEAAPRQQRAAPAESKPEKTEKIEVAGRVLDPDGKPVPAADVAVLLPDRVQAGKADDGGRFRLQVAQPAGPGEPSLTVLASAPGLGFGWSAEPGAEPLKDVVIRLHHEQTLRGRVLDLQGQPVEGAKVRVTRAVVSLPGNYVGLPDRDVPWLEPQTTGADGRFVLRGTGRDVQITLDVTDDRFTPELMAVEGKNKERPDEVSIVLAPPRTLSGQVVAADTGKPIPGARLYLLGQNRDFSGSTGSVSARADEEGRFTARPYRGEVYQAQVIPPQGQPYLGVFRTVDDWPKGALKHQAKFELPRGVVVDGTVVDEADGKPLAGAVVSYGAAAGNRNATPGVVPGTAPTGPDGAFRVTVLPGADYLLVVGPTPDYVRRELYAASLGPGGLSEDAKGFRVSPAGFARVDLKADARPDAVTIKLRRGVTVEGRLVNPDGRPVARAKMLSPLNAHPTAPGVLPTPVGVRDGLFRLRGCDPEKTYPVIFFDPENERGAAVEVSPKKAAREPITVRLAPCGSATARLIRRDGTPLKNYPRPPQVLTLDLVVTPGVPPNFTPGKAGLFADVAPVPLLAPAQYQGRHTDGEGRITLPALIPGATYRITGGYDPKEGFRFKDFKVESGQQLDLSDLKLDW